MGKTIKTLLAPVQNIINLGLRPGVLKTDLEVLRLSTNPMDFQVNADRLYELLIHHYTDLVSRRNDVDTISCCILANSGVEKILEHKSQNDIRQALVRLLINKDEKAINHFLRTLADSVATATVTAVPSATSSVN